MGPTIDTGGRVGFETRGDLSWSIGGPTARHYQSAAPGVGYNELLGSYFTQSVTFGVGIGDIDTKLPVRGEVGTGYMLRVSRYGAHHGLHQLFAVLFGVARTDKPFNLFMLGPRIEGTFIYPVDAGPGVPTELSDDTPPGMFFLGVAFEWIFWRFRWTVQEPPEPAPQPAGPTLVVPAASSP